MNRVLPLTVVFLAGFILSDPVGSRSMAADRDAVVGSPLERPPPSLPAARARDRIDVKDAPYGARCDGVLMPGGSGAYWVGTDDTAAFASARAAAQASGEAFYVPGGRGACLLMSGNPLDNLTTPMTIVGDGMDASRVVSFLDDPAGSLGPIVAPGTGYAVGDVLTVEGGVFSSAAMRIKVLATDAHGGVTHATAWGRASYTTLPPAPAAVKGGAGRGAAFSVVAGGSTIGSTYLGDAGRRPSSLLVEGLGLIGQGQQNPAQSSCGAFPIRVYDYQNVTIRDSGVDYSRCLSIATRLTDAVSITGNRVRWSSRDMINVSSSWTQIVDNRLEHGGDDGIATTAIDREANAPPVREGVVIASNFLTDVQGIVALGPSSVSITGNTLVRPKLRAIDVATGVDGEGATPTREVAVTGNVITDLLRVATDPISADRTSCFVVGSVTPRAGAAPAIPGTPTAAGEFVSPYPYFEQIGLDPRLPMPPGMDVTITGNSCTRTLPASPNGAPRPAMFSSLGFGLVYGSKGWVDFPLVNSAVAEGFGLQIQSGALRNLRMIGNTISGVDQAIFQAPGSQLIDADIRANTFRDIADSGYASLSPNAMTQHVVLDGNLWDGDPFFRSASRTTTGTARDGSPLFDGRWTGSKPTLLLQAPPGLELRNNRIRNFAGIGEIPPLTRAVGNVVYGDGPAGVGGPLPAASEGWDFIAEGSDPSSPTFGRTLGVTSRDLPPASIAGRYASTAGAPQPVAIGPGLNLSSAGVLTATGRTGAVVNSVSVGQPGAYVTTPTIAIDAPPPGGKQASASVTGMGYAAAFVRESGRGFKVGDTFAIEVDHCREAPIGAVTSVGAGGEVTGIRPSAAGDCLPRYPNPRSTTARSGSGSGLTVDIEMFVSATAVGSPGFGYTTVPKVAFSPTDSTLQFGTTATGAADVAIYFVLGTPGASGASTVSQGALVDGSGAPPFALTAAGYAVPANTSLVRFNQVRTVPRSTLTLPAAFSDGQSIQFVNQGAGAVAQLSFSPSVQGWRNGTQLAGGPGIGLRIRWEATSGTWQREQ